MKPSGTVFRADFRTVFSGLSAVRGLSGLPLKAAVITEECRIINEKKKLRMIGLTPIMRYRKRFPRFSLFSLRAALKRRVSEEWSQ